MTPCGPSGEDRVLDATHLQLQVTMGDTYGNKPVLDVEEEPLFAELDILRIYQKDGWKGVWVDTYWVKYRTSWGYGGVTLPPDKMKLLQEIYDRAGSRVGCFDVICWKDDYSLVFAESERKLVASSVILYSQLTE